MNIHCFIIIFNFLLLSIFTLCLETEKVSIILPIYNVEPYIEQCLDSIINQTYKNLEIICVNDCGNDNSIKIVEKYKEKDERIHIIYNEENKGQAISRNEGVKYSTGNFIFFLDSDDYLNLDIIEILVKKQKEKNYDVILSNIKPFIDSSSVNDKNSFKRLRRMRKNLKKLKKDEIQVSKDNFLDSFNIYWYAYSWGKLYKKDFLISNDIWHLNITHNTNCEDINFYLSALSSFPLSLTIEDIGVNYRISASSNSKYITKKDARINIDETISYIKNHKDEKTANDLIKIIINSKKYSHLYSKKEKKDL